ncbi:MAG: hypothetical protein ACFFDJ_09250 [Candidatus Odinarchaeota archaeon]
MTRLVMLEIGGLGFVRSIRPSPRKLRGDVCIVVVDESNKALWFWMGSGVQYDKRRTAKAKAEQISQEGQRIGDELIGRGFSLIEVDQDGLENPTTANNYNNLIALLDAPMEITNIPSPKGTLIIGQLQGSVPQTSPVSPATPVASAPSPTGAPAQPVVQAPSKRPTKLDMEAALMAVLRVHQEVHIEYWGKGETEEIIIEGVDGLTHKMKRSKGKLTFKWDPKTPKELKDLVALELKRTAG